MGICSPVKYGPRQREAGPGASSCSCGRVSREALQNHPAESGGGEDISSGKTAKGWLAIAPAPASLQEEQPWVGTFSHQQSMLGPTFPFSFPCHPPNLLVLLCCLLGRPGSFPCSQHSVSHLHLVSFFVPVLTPVPMGIGTQPSLGTLPTPNLSLLAAVAGGLGARAPGEAGMGSCPAPGWPVGLGTAGRQDGGCQHRQKEQLKTSRVQLVYPRARRLSGEMIALYKHTGGKHQAGG